MPSSTPTSPQNDKKTRFQKIENDSELARKVTSVEKLTPKQLEDTKRGHEAALNETLLTVKKSAIWTATSLGWLFAIVIAISFCILIWKYMEFVISDPVKIENLINNIIQWALIIGFTLFLERQLRGKD